MIDWAGIAGRINGLVRDGAYASPALAGIDEALNRPDLRERLQSGNAFETVRALTSAVRLYGIDPSWLVTGTFDATTHRVALDGGFGDTWRLVQRLLIEESAPAPEDEDDLTLPV